MRATESSLRETLFPPGSTTSTSTGTGPPYARVLLAFTPAPPTTATTATTATTTTTTTTAAGEAVGMALYFTNYSTWRAAPGIYLEDLFVRDEFRGRGIGTALLAALASQVRAIGGARLEWSVLKCPDRRRPRLPPTQGVV